MMSTHNRIIAKAAKAELGAIGFKRRGRSRLWLLDHGYWLNIVGFVPSRWSISVDLENAAHWVWAGHGFMSLSHSIGGSYADFETEQQFASALNEIAREAAVRALEIEDMFSSFEKIASFEIDRARNDERLAPSWCGYQAGLAAGILGDMKLAERFFNGVTAYPAMPHARRFLDLISDHSVFVAQVNEVIAQQRIALKLEPLTRNAF